MPQDAPDPAADSAAECVIEYFFSPLSPFCCLAGLRLEEIAARHRVRVRYIPFDIMKVFAAVGAQPVGKRHPSRQEYRLQELRRLARLSGIPLRLSPAHWPTDPAPASIALVAAQRAGAGDVGRAAHALMRACWVEEQDIARPEVIARALAEGGIDAGALSPDASDRAEYEANADLALARGVFGAPFYIVGDDRFWGQDRLGHLDLHLSGLL
ncbi:2-hydroxychromene-2-carboxylate isomerase [Oceanicella actignis]|uniref:2-hydroxychromene-2-carboxylate isomerase n=1 Tax=Oceanicella actignis TaxID=1189325 RepID=UPI0011E667A3|nr:2-hydroxychromene-2-carboxylate isomerase [Oceanicella actignis]TYO89545.1 2-hydroxychromene-2-carboxylate isomerase [Oceanicella actignis]